MDLFRQSATANLLPRDGLVRYLGPVFDPQDATRIFADLQKNIPWAHDEVVMFGKRITTARLVAWYGDEPFAYAYSGTCKRALSWNPLLCELKEKAEIFSGSSFNSCLLNFYQNGGEGMSWHSDDEKSLVADACIASISIGAERKFSFKHKQTKGVISLMLENGSLLLMEGETQRFWQHALPKTKAVSAPRINLTFRKMRQ
jgi:alkylated DNA repair dioxygenase AlkB